MKRQLEEKADVLAGFDSEEAVLLETIESVKASVVSIAGKDMLLAAEASDMDISKEEAATEAVNIDRQKLQQQEQALLMAIDTMKEDADKEASEKETPCKSPTAGRQKCGRTIDFIRRAHREKARFSGGPLMSHHGQSGPKGFHSVMTESDYVGVQHAVMLGAMMEYAVAVQNNGSMYGCMTLG